MNHRLYLNKGASIEQLQKFAENKFLGSFISGENLILDNEISLLKADANSYIIDAPKQREIAEGFDPYGFRRAFGQMVPAGAEARALLFALAVVRRIGGKVITAEEIELQPDHFTLPGVWIVSPYELSAEQLLQVVSELIKETRLVENAGIQRLEVPLLEDSKIEVKARRLTEDILAIAHVEWVKAGAVVYEVNYLPRLSEFGFANIHNNESREAYLGCSAIGKAIHQVVGGFILDSEGYLISENDLF